MLEVKKGLNNLSVATGLLIASLAQFSIVGLLRSWGFPVPAWVGPVIRVLGTALAIYSYLRRFFPIPWWVAPALKGVKCASK